MKKQFTVLKNGLNKYGKDLKMTQGRVDYTKFYYSDKEMGKAGFKLVKRGEKVLWS